MDYTHKSRNELIGLCKENSIKGYSNKKKAELIKLLVDTRISSIAIEPMNTNQKKDDSKQIKYIDLFCGLGAFHQAFDTNSQFECVFASDIDAGIQKIYKTNYGLDIHGDIRTIDIDKMPNFDILCAGFPCQPFSIAGNGEGFNDNEKGNLFYEILKIIDKKQPPMCILENVKNLKTHDDGKTYKTIETELTHRGYTVTSQVLNAVLFGSPQARQRIFIVATKNTAFIIPSGSNIINPVSSILDATIDKDDINRDKYMIETVESEMNDLSRPKIIANVFDKKTKKGGRQGERVYDTSHVGITVCASSGGPGAKTGLYKVGDTVRRLTTRETLGMFGFPSTYNLSDVNSEKALFYLGNSMAVNVAKAFVEPVAKWFQK